MLTETIDLTELLSDNIEYGFNSAPQLVFVSNYDCTIKHGEQIVNVNPLTTFSITFTCINFIASSQPLQIHNLKNNIIFNYCYFNFENDNAFCILNIKNSLIVSFLGEQYRSFYNDYSFYKAALNCEANSVVYINNTEFENFFVAISIDDHSQVFNFNGQNKFENTTYNVFMTNASTFLTGFPEHYVYKCEKYSGSKFNPIHYEKFVLNSATDQNIVLFQNKDQSKKLYELSVNSLPENTTIKVYIDSEETNLIVDSLNTTMTNTLNIFEQIHTGAIVAIEIIGTIPSNTIISIGLIESY